MPPLPDDGTRLNPGVSGALIHDERIGDRQYPIAKIYLGARNVDGGPVADENPMPVTVRSAFIPAPWEYDHIELDMTGPRMTGVRYYRGGAGGTLVATVTLAYTAGRLSAVTRT